MNGGTQRWRLNSVVNFSFPRDLVWWIFGANLPWVFCPEDSFYCAASIGATEGFGHSAKVLTFNGNCTQKPLLFVWNALGGCVIPCSLDGRVGWASGFPQLPFPVSAVPLSSPLSVLVEEGPRRPPAGKPLQLCDTAEPLLLSGTWVVRGAVVGSAFSSPLVLSFELDVF